MNSNEIGESLLDNSPGDPELGDFASESSGNAITRAVEKFFKIKERNSTIAIELKAGVVSFLTMSYILLINPLILEDAGLDKKRTAIATAVTSCVATLISGVIGNLPFGISPGMGVNTMFALTHVKIGGYSTELVLAWCLIANVALGVLATCHLLNFIMAMVPSEIKQGTIVGIGLLLAFIGMKNAGIIVANEETCVMLGPFFSNWHALLVMGELMIIASLMYHGIQIGLLVGILMGTITCWAIEHSWPTGIVELPDLLSCFALPSFVDLKWKDIANVIPYLLVLVFDVGGVMFGLGNVAGLVKDHQLEGSVWGYLGTAIGGILGAFMGTSPLIVVAESAAGVKVGGKTGLTAVVIALLFGLSVFILPIVTAIPADATGAVLILVGTLMMSECSHIQWDSMKVALPAFLTIVVQPLTFSIASGIYFGLFAAVVLWITSGQIFSDIKRLCSREEGDHIFKEEIIGTANESFQTKVDFSSRMMSKE